jgi:hypothetical protein
LERERWKGGGGEGWIFGEIPLKHALLSKTGLFRGEAAFSVQIFPWETEFMNKLYGAPEVPRQEKEPVQRVAQ